MRGTLDARTEIAARVGRAWAAGTIAPGERGMVRVRDLVYVCRLDRPGGELLVVTLWEEGDDPAVPRRYTDALRDRRRSVRD